MLLSRALDGLVDVIKDSLAAVHATNSGLEARTDTKAELSSSPDRGLDVNLLVRRLMGKLSDTFAADPPATGEMRSRHNYFKSTFYEPVSETGGHVVLKRTNFYYPPAMYPSPGSEYIKEEDHPRATAILAFRQEQLEVIQDVPAEMKKEPPSTRRWMELYAGQAANFKSMFSYPIIRGKPRLDPDRRIIGILTIDTNRAKYFREDIEAKASLTTLLHPYAIFIALLYEIEKQQRLLGGLEFE